MPAPATPKIYHITHVDNLPRILSEGVLWSDRERIGRGLTSALVGMDKIKRRRLEENKVDCHPPTMVGDYVPFYFCPRSVMLYILAKGNHPEVTWRGGQEEIVHLVADVRQVIAWADGDGRLWAFKDCNAGAFYGNYYRTERDLDKVDWSAVENHDFRSPAVKNAKQAEFLVHRSFPWTLVGHVGVHNAAVQAKVQGLLAAQAHQPAVTVESSWYY